MNKTSVSMKPVNGNAEIHNSRGKDLAYVRKDLTPSNQTMFFETIEHRMERIRCEYKRVTGQRLQPSAHPIKELVVVIKEDTASQDIEAFTDRLRKDFGMDTLSWAIHRDEGHYDFQGEWRPNYHAHVIVDCTCWNHEIISKTQRSNGKTVFDETGMPKVKFVDNYAKTRKYSKLDMSLLQDAAAETLGMDRGNPSSIKHLNAIEYKVGELNRDRIFLEKQLASLNTKIGVLKSQLTEKEDQKSKVDEALVNGGKELNTINASIRDRQASLALIENKESSAKQSVRNMTTIVYNARYSLIENIRGFALSIASQCDTIGLSQRVMEDKEMIEHAEHNDLQHLEEEDFNIAIERYYRFIMMALQEMIGLSRQAKEECENSREELENIKTELRHKSAFKSAKGAVLALFDKPANDQVKSLVAEVGEKQRTIEDLQKSVDSLIQEKADLTLRNSNLLRNLNDADREKTDWQNRYDTAMSCLSSERNYSKKCEARIHNLALSLVDALGIDQSKYLGIGDIIGQDLWQEALSKLSAPAHQKGMHR